MLLKHIAYYGLSRGVPGLVSFAALAVYTRILEPGEFGRYAVALTIASLANVVAFQWLRLTLMRNFSAHARNPEQVLSEIVYLFAWLVAIISIFSISIYIILPQSSWRSLFIYGYFLLITLAAFELVLTVAQARVRPLMYGAMLGLKSGLALAVGVCLILYGMQAAAPIAGLAVAHVVAISIAFSTLFGGVRLARPSPEVLRAALAYGVPLTAAFALSWIVAGSDRILIATVLGDASAGVYAASYDLGFNALTLLLVVINTAAYPLVIRALEGAGEGAAAQELRCVGEATIGVALSAGGVLIIFQGEVVRTFLGASYAEGAGPIFGLIVVSTVLAGIKAYYFDFAFQLSRSTHLQFQSVAVAAVTNLLLNFALIPLIGLLGAAIATLVAYALALGVSAYTGRNRFPMPPIGPMIGKATGVAAAVYASCIIVNLLVASEALVLVLGLLSAAASFVGMAWIVNLSDCRGLMGGRQVAK